MSGWPEADSRVLVVCRLPSSTALRLSETPAVLAPMLKLRFFSGPSVKRYNARMLQLFSEMLFTGSEPVMIVPVRTLTAVRQIVPDVSAVAELCQRFGANGMMVFTTMTVEQSSHVHTRMFAPLIGIVEDPATGSASGALGAYLVQHGAVDVGEISDITSEQGYEIERPSRIFIRVMSEDDAIQGVTVGGQAVMLVEGSLSF